MQKLIFALLYAHFALLDAYFALLDAHITYMIFDVQIIVKKHCVTLHFLHLGVVHKLR